MEIKYYPKYVNSIVNGTKILTVRKVDKVKDLQVGQIIKFYTTEGNYFGKAVIVELEKRYTKEDIYRLWMMEGYECREDFMGDIDRLYENEELLSVIYFKYVGA